MPNSDQYPATSDEEYFTFQNLLVFDLHAAFVLGHLQEVSPFLDNNFNPGISLSKALIYRNQLMGVAVLSFEHESNGRDSLASRSWNYISLSGSWFIDYRFSTQLKLWAGWVDKEGNPDLLKYKGYGFIAFNYQSADERLWCSAVINPRRKFINMNTTLEINFKPLPKANEYFFFFAVL